MAKLVPQETPVAEHLAGLSEQRQEEAQTLIEMMRAITGLEATLWGGGIIGFGLVHYRYDSGHEGDMPAISFAPRKAKLSIYFMEGFDHYSEQLAALGKHSIGKGCLYITTLAKVDLIVLHKMLSESFRQASQQRGLQR